ncbi:MAG: cell division protein FtsA [Candidatus Magasanikbacteria bacterium]|nr:cell division protein FtsA [Candidatus Magasanikbacteria bacterium]
MYITSLDIGTSEIRALVALTRKDHRLSLAGLFKSKAEGLRKGEIVNIDDASRVLTPLFNDIKKIHKTALKNIFLGVGGSNIKMESSRGIVAVSRSDNEIYQDDVERVIKASQAISLGSNRMILHTLTREFIVDGISGIADPLGMTGNRLEVQSLIIHSFKSNINSLIKCVEAVGGEVAGLIFNPLAAGRAVLSKIQKDLGVVMVDIGAGTSGVCIYEENNLLQVVVLPMGAANITNDLAIGLRCGVGSAETIKLSFGFALPKEVGTRERLELQEIDPNLKSSVTRRFISEIIEVRLAEIFELVNNELKLAGRNGRLPAGVVITGGGAKMPGIVDLAKEELKLPAQIGIPILDNLETSDAEARLRLEDPQFAVAVGLLLWGGDESLKGKWSASKKSGWISKIFKNFLP